MELCLVINLTKGSIWTVPRPSVFATGYVSCATTFYTWWQVLPTEKVNSNTGWAGDSERLCAMELHLQLKRFPL